MKAALCLSVPLVFLSACAHGPYHEMHALQVSEPGSGGGGSSKGSLMGGLLGGSKAPADAAAKTNEEPPEKLGSWFIRTVQKPSLDERDVVATEILWCDTDQPDMTRCRVAVAWARTGSGGLGPQAGYVGAARTQASQSSPSGEGDSLPETVRTQGRGFDQLTGSEAALLRRWIGSQVRLNLSYDGKSVQGSLVGFDASGVAVAFANSTPTYGWQEIQALQRLQ